VRLDEASILDEAGSKEDGARDDDGGKKDEDLATCCRNLRFSPSNCAIFRCNRCSVSSCGVEDNVFIFSCCCWWG
jgi:hypothetical protein